jgi:regulator of sigma E protease
VDKLGYEMGLRNGDKIVSIDQKQVEDFAAVPKTILLEEAKTVQVIRNEQPMDIIIPEGFINKMIQAKSADFVSFLMPFEADRFTPDSPAKKAGMQVNDRIVGINDSLFPYFDQFRRALQGHKDQLIDVVVLRNADTVKLKVKVSAQGLIGVYPKPPSTYFQFKEKSFNVFTAIPAGFTKTFKTAGDYLKSLKLLFSQEKAYESVGGFIAIGNIFPSVWDWQVFWSWTAFLSIMLAILNVLPIPALDGGHVLFLFYEIIFRRKPSDKFMEYAQYFGMIILFSLLIFANANDVIKLFRN